jgi:hypothetical protein
LGWLSFKVTIATDTELVKIIICKLLRATTQRRQQYLGPLGEAPQDLESTSAMSTQEVSTRGRRKEGRGRREGKIASQQFTLPGPDQDNNVLYRGDAGDRWQWCNTHLWTPGSNAQQIHNNATWSEMS